MGRTPCCDKSGLKRGPWTSEEDQKLINYIQNHGPRNWRNLPKNAGLERCGKSCRLRWANYLRPDIKRGRFSFEEEETIIQLHSIMGNKWSAIAARLPGRTDNEIKNYWNTHIRKRMLKMGLDPVTHAPRLDLLELSSILSSALCNPSLFNLSNLIGTQAVVNPELLKLLSNFTSLKSENSELFSENFQQMQLGNISQLQSQLLTLQNNNNQFQMPTAAPNMEGLLSNISNFSSQLNSLQANSLPSYIPENFVAQQNYAGLQGNPSFEAQNNCGNHYQSYDSVLSTPISSPTPLNSSSTHVNSATEDERDSYCSNLFKFEIPDQSLDISDYL